MMIRKVRQRGPAVAALVAMLVAPVAPAVADEPSAATQPRALEPDAPLPDIAVAVDLGARNYDRAQEDRHQDEVDQFVKELELITDPDKQARLEAIAHPIITAAARLGPRQVRVDRGGSDGPGLTWTFRIIDSDGINAFSAWGGNIFVTRGMLEFCRSDHELAGILAHEVAHTLYRHLRQQIKRQQQLQPWQLLAIGLGLALGEPGGALLMTQLATMGILNQHSVDAEEEADRAAVYYTYRAGYNPVGLVTVFERLYRWEMSRPGPEELGVFKTHPWSEDRAETMLAQIRALGLPINRRAVIDGATARVATAQDDLDGKLADEPPIPDDTAALLLGKVRIMLVGEVEDETAVDRAQRLAEQINEALEANLTARWLRLERADDDYVVLGQVDGRPVTLLTITAADAALAQAALDEHAKRVYQRLLVQWRQDEFLHG